MAACLNDPFNQELQIAKEEAAEEIVIALEEIAEIIREMLSLCFPISYLPFLMLGTKLLRLS